VIDDALLTATVIDDKKVSKHARRRANKKAGTVIVCSGDAEENKDEQQ